MTDSQIDSLIERVKPELRTAFKALISGTGVHIFNFADGANSSSGVKSKIVCFLAHEAPAAILEGTAQGIDAAQKVFLSQMRTLQDKTILAGPAVPDHPCFDSLDGPCPVCAARNDPRISQRKQ